MRFRNIISIIILLCISSFANAQNALNTEKAFKEGATLYKQNKFKEALAVADKAIALYQSESEKSSLDYANWLNNKALTLIAIPDYKQAVALFREASRIYSQHTPENKKDFMIAVESMIDQIEDVSNATEVYLKDHPDQKEDIAKSNLTSLNMMTSSIISCEEEAIGSKLPVYTSERINLENQSESPQQENSFETEQEEINKLYYQFQTLQDKGEYAQAVEQGRQIQSKLKQLPESYFEKNLHITKKYNLAILDIDMIACGIMSKQQGDMVSQISACAKTLEKENTTKGYYAQAPLYEAVIKAYEQTKDTDNVIKYKETLAQGYKQYYGDTKEYGALLYDIAALYSHKYPKNAKIGLYMSEAIHVAQQIVTSAFPLLPEAQRDTYWEEFKPWISSAVNLAIQYPEDQLLAKTAYNAMLLSKGILLTVATDMGKIIAQSGDQELIDLFEQLKDIRKQLETAQQEKEKDADKIKTLTAKADRIETILNTRTMLYGNYTSRLNAQWENVAKSLPDNATAVEFAVANNNNDKQQTAFVLRKDWAAPKVVVLGSLKELTQLTKDGAATLSLPEVTDKIWTKIIGIANIKDKETIYFSPDGMVNQYGVEYLTTTDGSIMSDKYNMVRLSSTKEIYIKDSNSPTQKAQLYGDILFSSDREALVTSDCTRGGDIEEFLSRSSEKPQGSLHNLPATAKEVEMIDSLLTTQRYSVNKKTGEAATEASFKNLADQHIDILHIATHGFYWTERNAKHMKMSFLHKKGSAEERAMTRSGLFVAGANYVLGGTDIPKGLEDGVLTSREIADVNLSNVNMVVLSACQTGLGEDAADGVFGLQRGFKKAGVHTLVMSLWKVDDRATQILMEEFYKNIAQGVDKHKALTLAQNTLRHIEDGKYKDPYYWAAFIMLD